MTDPCLQTCVQPRDAKKLGWRKAADTTLAEVSEGDKNEVIKNGEKVTATCTKLAGKMDCSNTTDGKKLEMRAKVEPDDYWKPKVPGKEVEKTYDCMRSVLEEMFGVECSEAANHSIIWHSAFLSVFTIMVLYVM